MKIKTKLSQHGSDFRAIYECEHCGSTSEGDGYADAFFHNNVIPQMQCLTCRKTRDRPLLPGEVRRSGK